MNLNLGISSNSMSTILKIDNLNKSFDGIKALDEFSCSLMNNEILGLIGPNGAGKSTLFNIITNFLPHDSGEVFFFNQKITNMAPHKIIGLGIFRTFQNLRLIGQLTLVENILLSFQNQPGESVFNIFLNNSHCKKVENENLEISNACT